MEEKLSKLKEELKEKLVKATKEADILNIKGEYIGKKSEIASILSLFIFDIFAIWCVSPLFQ